MSSGLNWAQAKSLRQADPYLAWADLTNYASYRLPKVPDKKGWWLVLIELVAPDDKLNSPIDQLLDASAPQWLRVSDVYLDKRIKQQGFRFCTARVGQAFFQAVLSGTLKSVVRRYKLCSPVEYPVEPLSPPNRSKKMMTKATRKLAGDSKKGVLALIDGGLAFANSTFLDSSQETRLSFYWRQDDYLGSRYLRDRTRTSAKAKRSAPWKKVKDLGYGAEMDRQGMNQAMHPKLPLKGRIDESAVYDQLGLWDLDRLVHHGTHVASLAAGSYRYPREPGTKEIPPFWQGAEGSDPQGKTCDVIAVQLAWANILDTSCRACDAYILDALMYTWVRTHQDAHLVVNISWGGAAGPHDGSSILERAMLAWCDLRKLDLTQIVVPAGNNYQSRMHANAVVSDGRPLELTWRIPADGHTPNFLELWFERLTKNLSVELIAPDGLKQRVLVCAKKRPVQTMLREGKVVATVVLVENSFLGKSPMALVAIEPTAGPGPLAWSGQWRVSVSSEQEVKVDAFVERNDVAIGLFTGAKQSYLEDHRYNVGEAGDHAHSSIGGPSNESPVRRRGSFNHLSTGSDGRRVLSVGGIRYLITKQRLLTAAPYSPPWETTTQTRPRRPNAKEEPDTVAISDLGSAVSGVRAGATRSGAVVRLVGTSSAVPLVARLLINEDGVPQRPSPLK